NDRGDCGAAALATLALHFGLPVALERVRDLADCNRDGASLLGLLRGAEKLGLSAKAVRVTKYESLSTVPLPAVAHIADAQGNGHFVVVYRVTKKHVLIADPARAVERRGHDQFRREWSGNLLLASPSAGLTRDGKGRQSTSPTGRFLRLLASQQWLLLEIIV